MDYIALDSSGNPCLYHSYKGTRWKKHKYIRVTEDGRYVYSNTKNANLSGNSKTNLKEYSLEGLKDALDVSGQKDMTDVPKQKGLVNGIKRTVNTISKEVSGLTRKKQFGINKWNTPIRNVKRSTMESGMAKVTEILTKTGSKKLTDTPKLPKKPLIKGPKKVTTIQRDSRIRRR